jgi:hypothetical protein
MRGSWCARWRWPDAPEDIVGTATGMSNVVKTDVQAKNGVIHVIDAVMLP